MTTTDSFAGHAQGWSTTPDGEPYFTVGRHRLDTDGLHTHPDPVWNDRLGINVPNNKPGTNVWREELSSDITTVLDTYTAAFTDPATAAVVLAAMTRPTVPLTPCTTLALTGGPGCGKSLAATLILAGWQATPGVIARYGLPGSGSDTPAFTDYAVQNSPIWVLDSADFAAPEHLNRVVRAVHRGEFPQRMTPAGTPEPPRRSRAMLVLTSGQLHGLGRSVRDRIVEVPFTRSTWASDEHVDAVMSMRDHDEAPSRLLAGNCIREMPSWTHAAWQAFRRDRARSLMSAEDPGASLRRCTLLVDLSLGLRAMADLSGSLGLESASAQIKDLIHAVETLPLP